MSNGEKTTGRVDATAWDEHDKTDPALDRPVTYTLPGGPVPKGTIDWESWADAKPIPLEGAGSVQVHALQCAEQLRVASDETVATSARGDSMVVAYRQADGSIAVYDCVIRRHGEVRS